MSQLGLATALAKGYSEASIILICSVCKQIPAVKISVMSDYIYNMIYDYILIYNMNLHRND